ncbi:hypothetical protein BJV78DRAFT_1154866 [Lactifluus subvellereus]|nr:hypothetical protein BJV78DRAFT_1154866 [Lactifluus subvellereus]
MPLHHQLQEPGSSPTKGPPPPHVVRLVQTVIGDPVEEEEAGEECLIWTRSGCRTLASYTLHQCPPAVTARDGAKTPSDEANGGESVDGEGVGNAMGTPTARGKAVQWGRKRICHEPDEEDDGLMMYANLKALPHPPSPLVIHLLDAVELG